MCEKSFPHSQSFGQQENCGIDNSAERTIADIICANTDGVRSSLSRQLLEAALDIAPEHGVEPLLYYSLKNKEIWESVPEDLRERLTARVKFYVAVELLMSHDLQGVINLLNRENIKIVLLKGAALAISHYPEPYLRTRCDTDIYIDAGDIERVISIFKKSGYFFSNLQLKSHQFNCTKKVSGNLVISFDIHWRLSNAPRYSRLFSHQEIERSLRKIGDIGEIFAFNTVDSLLLACMHLAGNPEHNDKRLIWLYDIHLIVQSMTQDQCDEFVEKAVTKGINEVCRRYLLLAKEYFYSDISAEMLLQLDRESKNRIFRERVLSSYLFLIISDIIILPTFGLKISLLKELMFPSPEELKIKYGPDKSRYTALLYIRYYLEGIAKRVFRLE